MLSKQAELRPTATECLRFPWLQEKKFERHHQLADQEGDDQIRDKQSQDYLIEQMILKLNGMSSLEIAATNLSHRYRQKINKTLCISQRMKVKDLLS